MEPMDELRIPPPDLDDDEVDYLGAAFWHQYNVISLVGLLGLGLFVPGLFYLTVAAELAYLALLPSDDRFRRMVRSEANRSSLERIEERSLDLLGVLGHAEKRRYLELTEITGKIRSVAGTVDYSSRLLVEQDLAKLDYLLRTFLQMLVALSRLREHLSTVDREAIRQDVRRLTKEMESAKPRVRAVKERNVDILQQRLTRLERAEDDRELIEANLDTIEATLKLIRDNVVSLNKPEGISDQIDLVVTNMKENERLMESMSSFLDEQAQASRPTVETESGPSGLDVDPGVEDEAGEPKERQRAETH